MITVRAVTVTMTKTPRDCSYGWRQQDEMPQVFKDPDQFDLRRPDADRHLAFGKDLGYCLGANLGKRETQIASSHLARRYPQFRLAPDQQLSFHPNISFRGPQALMVRAVPQPG